MFRTIEFFKRLHSWGFHDSFNQYRLLFFKHHGNCKTETKDIWVNFSRFISTFPGDFHGYRIPIGLYNWKKVRNSTLRLSWPIYDRRGFTAQMTSDMWCSQLRHEYV